MKFLQRKRRFNMSYEEELFSKDEAKELDMEDRLPPGDYSMTITKAEVRTKDDKKWLSIGFQIDEGMMAGRTKFFSFYLKNGHPNPNVCSIHARIRRSLDSALGLDKMTLENIIGRSVVAKIKQSEKNGTIYENVDQFLPAR
jgi:hypothetical protein